MEVIISGNVTSNIDGISQERRIVLQSSTVDSANVHLSFFKEDDKAPDILLTIDKIQNWELVTDFSKGLILLKIMSASLTKQKTKSPFSGNLKLIPISADYKAWAHAFEGIRSASGKGVRMTKSVRITSGCYDDHEDDTPLNTLPAATLSQTQTPLPSASSHTNTSEIWAWVNSIRKQTGLPELDMYDQHQSHQKSLNEGNIVSKEGNGSKGFSKSASHDDEDDDEYESDDERKTNNASFNAQRKSHLLFKKHNEKTKRLNKQHEIEMARKRDANKFGFGGNDDDDGDGGEEVKGKVEGVDQYAKFSLFCLGKKNLLRRACIALELDPYFHQFIFILILYNTILLGMSDYSHIVTDPSNSQVGELDSKTSDRNYVIDASESPLAFAYAAEMVIRVTAMGFWVYLADYWNVLDFVVSIAGVVSLVTTNSPVNLNFLRTFRVLRPLRFIQRLKGMRVLVQSTLQAIPELAAVMGLCLFVFVLFGIMAVQLFGGVVHARCRLTPYPVTLDWQLGKDPALYRCLIDNRTVVNFNTVLERPKWGKEDSPWYNSQRHCYWPIDEEDERVCDLFDESYKSSKHACAHNTRFLNESEWRWCGSNYDALGNDRFGVTTQKDVFRYVTYFNESFSSREMDSKAGAYTEAFNWGLTTFDSFPRAFVTIFQIITLEGWVVVMYMVMDGVGSGTAFFFIVLVMIGSIFILNLVLAVLESNFTESREAEKRAEEERSMLGAGLKLEDYDQDGNPVSNSPNHHGMTSILSQFSIRSSQSLLSSLKLSKSEEKKSSGKTDETYAKFKLWLYQKYEAVKQWCFTPPSAALRLKFQKLISHHLFDKFILFLIIANTVVLACDRYPISNEEARILEIMNLALTVAFTLEMVFKVIGSGFWIYIGDMQNTLDAVIVVTSLVELYVAPPVILGGADSDGGVITALRCMRLFRIFKMAKKWKAMNDLMNRFIKTIADVTYVALLMLLLLYIFVLLGMQLFANHLRFDAFGYAVKIGKEEWFTADIPRANFDTFEWAFVTVFSVLTGENWNAVLYDCWRAVGPTAVIYFFALLIVGMFVVLNLFLAVLLSNFSEDDDNVFHDENSEVLHLVRENSFEFDDGDSFDENSVIDGEEEGENTAHHKHHHKHHNHEDSEEDGPRVLSEEEHDQLHTMYNREYYQDDKSKPARTTNHGRNQAFKSKTFKTDDMLSEEDGPDSDHEDDLKRDQGVTQRNKKGRKKHLSARLMCRVESTATSLKERALIKLTSRSSEEARDGIKRKGGDIDPLASKARGGKPMVADSSRAKSASSLGSFGDISDHPSLPSSLANDQSFFVDDMNIDIDAELSNKNKQIGQGNRSGRLSASGKVLSRLNFTPEAIEERKRKKKEKHALKTSFVMPACGMFGEEEISRESYSEQVKVVPLSDPPIVIGQHVLNHAILDRVPILKPLSEASFHLERVALFGGDIKEADARKGLTDILAIIDEGVSTALDIEALESDIYRLTDLSVFHEKEIKATSLLANESKKQFEKVKAMAKDMGLLDHGHEDMKEDTYGDEAFEVTAAFKKASMHYSVSETEVKASQLQHENIIKAIKDTEQLLIQREAHREQVILDGESMINWVNKVSLNGKRRREAREKGDRFEDDEDDDDDANSENTEERRLRKIDNVYPLQEGSTLFLFSVNSPTRLLCAYVCSMPMFEKVTMFLIFLSSIALAIDSPLMNPASTTRKVLDVFDVFFTYYFLMEMVVKVITYGLWFMPKAYLKDGFNALDFFIAITGVLSLYGGEGGGPLLKSLRALRALRSLRPLRIIKRFDSLKIVVNALINVVPDVVNVLLLCLLFFIMFGVIFVQNLKGKFFMCQGNVFDNEIAGTSKEEFLINPVSWSHMTSQQKSWFHEDGVDDDIVGPSAVCGDVWTSITEVPTSKMVCKCLGAKWSPMIAQNFDNINNALWTLYELSTTEGWLDVALAAVDVREIDMQPVRDYNVSWAFMFVIFMFTGSFFFMNLFVGVLYERFVQAQTDLEGGRNFLTKEQEEYIVAQRLSVRFKPVPKLKVPSNRIRLWAFHMVTHFYFEVTILSAIIANSIVMALSYFGQDDLYGLILESFNFGFATIFTIEAMAKLLAFGRQYFHDRWNCFDFSIVLGTMFGILVRFFANGGGGGFIVALRAFRLARILRIIKGAEALQEMINTLLFTLAGLVNVMGLLFLLFFVYTVMGMQLFAKVAYNGDLDVHANFRTFGNAMLTLFRFATGENWNGFMYDVSSAGGSACVSDPEYNRDMCGFNDRPGCEPLNGCGNDAIFLYLYSFVMVAFFVSLNLFVGVILDAFQNANESGRMFRLSDMEKFQSAWSQYDRDACGFIDTVDLLHLMQHLPEPWGFGGEVKATQYQVRQRIASLHLPLYAPGSSVFYYDVFFALTAAVILEKEKAVKRAEKEELKRKRFVFEELERRRNEAKERMEFENRLKGAVSGIGSGRTSPFSVNLESNSRPNSPFINSQYNTATIGQNYDNDEDDLNEQTKANQKENQNMPKPSSFGEDMSSQSSSDSDSVSSSSLLSVGSADPIKEMIHGGKPSMFDKTRKAVNVLCHRHGMRDHKGSRPLTASDDYAARFIQKKYILYKNSKQQRGENQDRYKSALTSMWRESATHRNK